MLKFSSRVRISLSAQFIRLSWVGAGTFGFLGWTKDSGGLVIVGLIIWWLAFQTFGHVILAYEDDDNDGDPSGNSS